MNKDKRYAEKVASRYTDKNVTKVEKLRQLDHKAKKPALIFAYVFGSIAALVLGFGMSVAMQVILKDFMIVGIIVGCAGILMCVANYYIYKRILKSSTNKYAKEIVDLSNEIINE